MLSDSSSNLPAVLEFKVVYVDALTGDRMCFTTYGSSSDEAIANLCRSRAISDIVHIWDAALVESVA